jgi:hypothetical protein
LHLLTVHGARAAMSTTGCNLPQDLRCAEICRRNGSPLYSAAPPMALAATGRRTRTSLVTSSGRGWLLGRAKGLGSGCDGGGVGGAGEREAPRFPSSLVLGRGPSYRFSGCSLRAPRTSTTSGMTVMRIRSMRLNIPLAPAVTLRGSSETIGPLETDWRGSGLQWQCRSKSHSRCADVYNHEFRHFIGFLCPPSHRSCFCHAGHDEI